MRSTKSNMFEHSRDVRSDRAAQPHSRARNAQRTLASLHPHNFAVKIRDVPRCTTDFTHVHSHRILHSMATNKTAGSSYTSDSFPLKCAIRGAPQRAIQPRQFQWSPNKLHRRKTLRKQSVFHIFSDVSIMFCIQDFETRPLKLSSSTSHRKTRWCCG